MDLAAFRAAVDGYRRPTGHTQQELAAALGVHAKVLSHKLHGSDGAALRHDEVKTIVRVLAAWQALTTRAEAIELLALMDLAPSSFSSLEWSAPPLATLETDSDPMPIRRETARAATGQAPRVRLPAELTPLVGRTDQMQQLLGLLQGEARLVTLTGTGGTGKTRLALAAAAALAQRSATEVCVVALAAIRNPELVPGTVAAELDLREPAGGRRRIEAVLLEHLRDRRLLLVLDNLEQVLGAASLIAEVVRVAPGVRVLATSRVPLRLYGEHEVRVPPLRLPSPGASEQEVLASEAVALFVQRARAARADFWPGPGTAALLSEICARLDGLPLAIELAAARVRHLSLQVLLDRLAHRLEVLDRGPRDVPARQRTLRATLDWSYELLPVGRQHLFERLGVFIGGCTLEAVQAVCAEAEEDLEDGLWELVDNALLEVTNGSAPDGPPAEPRFGMLETVREYALARLATSGEAASLERRHRDWCLALVEGVSPDLLDGRHFAQLDLERENLRAALRSAIAAGEAETGWRLGLALKPLWYVRGSYTEGRAWLAELLALPAAAAPSAPRAGLLAAAGHLSYCQGDYSAAAALLEEARPMAAAMGDEQAEAIALHFLGNVAWARGDLARAWAMYEQTRVLTHRLGSRAWEGSALVSLASVAEEQSDYGLAARLATESLAVYREVNHTWGTARALRVLGHVATSRGDHAVGRALLEEAVTIQRALGDRQGLVWSLLALAQGAAEVGDARRATELLAEGLGLAKEAGDRLAVARSLEAVAAMVAGVRPERAVRLAGAAGALRDALGAQLTPAERDRLDRSQATARCALGQAAYARLWTDGQRQPLAQAMADAVAATEAVAASLPAEAGADPLTPRERQVALLLARGLSNRQIGEVLVITEGTARIHAEHVLGKLGLRSRVQVAAWARTHGLLADSDA